MEMYQTQPREMLIQVLTKELILIWIQFESAASLYPPLFLCFMQNFSKCLPQQPGYHDLQIFICFQFLWKFDKIELKLVGGRGEGGVALPVVLNDIWIT